MLLRAASAPTITNQPVNQVVSPGGTANFGVQASGAPPLRYYWKKGNMLLVDDGRIQGATTAGLTIADVQGSDLGVYSVTVSNMFGVARSDLAFVAISPVTIAAWGGNSYGQSYVPEGLTNVAAISAGGVISLALKTDGTVASWGYPSEVPSGLNNAVAIAAAGSGGMALKADRTVVTWGSPLLAGPARLTNVVAVAAGDSHCLALRGDGTVVAWGSNLNRQTNVPLALSSVVAVAAGVTHSLALLANGTCTGWGQAPDFIPPVGLSNVVALEAGNHSSAALKRDGTVVPWGSAPPFWTNFPPNLTNATALALGYAHGIALTSEGTLVGWGDSERGQLQTPDGLGPLVAISAGGSHNLAMVVGGEPSITVPPLGQSVVGGASVTLSVTAAGEPPLAYQWRFSSAEIEGATSASLTLTNFHPAQEGLYSVTVTNRLGTATSADAWLTLGPVTAWGGGPLVPPGLSDAVVVAGGHEFALALREDGQVFAWGIDSVGETKVPPGLSNVVAVSAGNDWSVALKDDGTVAAWGRFTNAPPGLSDVVAITTSGGGSTLALRSDGTVVSWGVSSTPPVPPDLTNVVSIAASDSVCLAVRSDGTVAMWGRGGTPATNLPPGLAEVIAVAAGVGHGAALRREGTVVSWGWDAATNVPPGLGNVVAIAAGRSHTLALEADGDVVSWGQNATVPPDGLHANFIACSAFFDLGLAIAGDLPTGPQLLGTAIDQDGFQTRVSTVRGRSYFLEYTESFDTPRWLMLPPVPGNGTVRVLTDHSPSGGQRFYRVRQY